MNMEAMSDPQLERMYHNCVAAITSEKPTAQQARARLIEINHVWEKRMEMARTGDYRFESPDVGMLKRLGYRVGKDAVPVEKRRPLLDFAIFGILPFVGSPAYMIQWGDVGSETRYRKLHRVLASCRTSAAGREEKTKACSDWAEDIAYIEDLWRNTSRKK